MKKFIILSVIFFSSFFNTEAQESIDLTKAIETAIHNNTTISNLQKNLQIQELSIKAANGNLFPNLNLTGSWNRNNTFSNGTIRFQNGVPIVIPKQNTWINNFSTGLNSSVTIFNGFANYEQVNLERQNEISIRIQLDKQRYDVVYNVNAAFFDVIKKEKIVQANTDNLKDSQAQLESVKAFMTVGKRTIADVYRQDVQVAQNELQLERSINDYEKSKVDLLLAMNTDLNKTFVVSESNININLSEGELKAIVDKYSSTEVLLNRALENRFDYKSSLQDIKISQTQLSIDRKSLYFPTLDVFANYNLNASRIENIQDSRSLSFGLSLSYPIFQNFKSDTKMQTSEITILQRQDALRQLEQQIRGEIKKSYLDLETFYKQIEILNRNIVSAQQDKLLSEENYRVGLGTLLDVQTATTKLNTLIIDRINAYYDFLLGERKIVYYVGNLSY